MFESKCAGSILLATSSRNARFKPRSSAKAQSTAYYIRSYLQRQKIPASKEIRDIGKRQDAHRRDIPTRRHLCVVVYPHRGVSCEFGDETCRKHSQTVFCCFWHVLARNMSKSSQKQCNLARNIVKYAMFSACVWHVFGRKLPKTVEHCFVMFLKCFAPIFTTNPPVCDLSDNSSLDVHHLPQRHHVSARKRPAVME